MLNGSENLESAINNPEAEILAILNEIAVMGGNDHEQSAIEEILTDLRANKVSAIEAVGKARNILTSKQDYH